MHDFVQSFLLWPTADAGMSGLGAQAIQSTFARSSALPTQVQRNQLSADMPHGSLHAI